MAVRMKIGWEDRLVSYYNFWASEPDTLKYVPLQMNVTVTEP